MYLQYQHFSESVKRYFQVVRETWCIQVPISRGRYSSELCLAWSYLPHCLYPVELIEVTFVLCQVRRLKLSILRQIHSCQPSQTGWDVKRNETVRFEAAPKPRLWVGAAAWHYIHSEKKMVSHQYFPRHVKV